MNTNAAFPNSQVSDSEKKEAYHKQAVEAITSRSFNSSYTLNYASMNESVNFFQGLQSGDEYKFMQEAEDGDILPAKWMNLNRIRPKLSIVLGEFMEKGYDIQVKALNKAAVSRKLEEKERIRVQMWLQPAAQMVEEQSGLPIASEEKLPETEEDLDIYIQSTYKETSEIVMESMLKWLAKRFNWEYTRMELFRDMLIQGRMFARVELVDGLPRIRRVDPRLMIFDTDAQDDYLSDSTFFGEVRYMPISEVIEKYALNKEEIKELTESGGNKSEYSRTVGAPTSGNITTNVNFFKQEGGQLRVLVLQAYWKDTKNYNHRVSVDKYGTTHNKPVDDKVDGEDIKKNKLEIWRKGTMLGGTILKDWGELEDRATDIDNLGPTYPPYISCIPFYMNGTGVSTTQLMKPLQDLKNITMYNIQLAMNRAGAKGIMYDIAQLPEGVDFEQMLKYLKVVGVGIFDSKKDGTPSAYNQFSQFDLSITDGISNYLAIMGMIDREMDAISGINEARQGIAQGASQAVGVTQSSLFQSNFATAPLMKLFRMASSMCLDQQARLAKIAWANKEKFAPIIGDTGIDFLKDDIELDLNDYGVFVDEITPMLDDISMFREFVMAAIQSGGLTFIDGLDLLQEKDIKVATRQFKKAVAKREKEAQEQAAMQQQAQAEAMMQQQQMIGEQAQQKYDANLALEGLRGQNQKGTTLLKGKFGLSGKKLDLLK